MYCTLDEIRAEGITTEQASDARINLLIPMACQYIDQTTRQFFEPREFPLLFDGRNEKMIFLPVFPIEVTAVTVNGAVVTDCVFYNRFFPDDRRVPRVLRPVGFPTGNQNVSITAKWGFVEKVGTDYKTPAQINQVAKKLVIREIPTLADTEGQEEKKRGRIISENTDGHSYTLDKLVASANYTGDPEIDEVLFMYRAPVSIGGV
jgi:hypothetical protein